MSDILFLLLAVYLDKIHIKSNGPHEKYYYVTEKSEDNDRFIAKETQMYD